MKHFYAGTFMNREALKKVGINYPIKLEYYKTKPSINMEQDESNTKYGIEVVKTSYIKDCTNIENIKIREFTKDEKIVDKIIKILKNNEVTPVNAECIVDDLLKQLC